MYVCICHAVTDERIKATIDAGAATVEAVTRACRAGGDCGTCRGTIAEMIEDRRPSGAAGPSPLRLPLSRERAA